jgi:Uracil DNA glycosylase superfamily
VFGEGPAPADVMLVGEQPGDREDLEGKPFVGPAGRLLDEALEQAGIDRSRTYLTNAVKHFKWKPRGKRRIHDRPRGRRSRPVARGWRPNWRPCARARSCSWERRRATRHASRLSGTGGCRPELRAAERG